MRRKLSHSIFLIIAIGSLVVPSCYYWIYPHPQKIKQQKADLKKIHNKRVVNIQKAIETAQKHQHDHIRVFGGAEPWKQAERDELA